ncbi:ribonuclease P protein component [Nocardioides pocheonensis]|uniref:Ribonuclease P protein component n=1 Tax=Nocardioides pocheonensis TaxID=661485 RepID=A0A3N0GKJ8_9ACTN|nr:ribonuclease P protein component [Nocardioides pocheonensis]RNM12590.1 ribonuclease P protein component [Nocardioides pocheonensis]
MLSASHRLSAAGEFRQAVRQGRRAGGPLVVVHLATGYVDKATSRPGDPEAPRVGFVVSKAVGPAVTRNQVKRRLRHLMRERVGRLEDGALLVVRAQPAAAGASYRDLAAELDRCLDRVVGS